MYDQHWQWFIEFQLLDQQEVPDVIRIFKQTLALSLVEQTVPIYVFLVFYLMGY